MDDYDPLPEPDDRAALDYLDEEYALWIADAKAQQEYRTYLDQKEKHHG